MNSYAPLAPLPQAPIDVASLARVPVGHADGMPSQPGVYLAIDDAGRVWYVGIAQSLRDRIATHDRLSEFRQHRVTAFAWRTEQSESDCRSLERQLIEFFHPPLNVQHNFNALPAADLGLTPDEEIERFLRLRVQYKLIELELEALKPNVITRCEQSGGKISTRLGMIYTQCYKSWEYSEKAQKVNLELRQLQQQERQNGIAKIKSEKIGAVARLSGDALSSEVAILLSRIEDHEEELAEV